MYIPPPHHQARDDVDILSATFCFQFLCNNPAKYGRRVDMTSNWAAAAVLEELGIILKCEPRWRFLSVGLVLTGLAQHFTLASVTTRSPMPRALSTTLTSRDPLLGFLGSEGSANNN